MKERLFLFLPVFLQEVLISIFNYLAYRKRMGRNYLKYVEMFKSRSNLTSEELRICQKQRFENFLKKAIENSNFYEKYPEVGVEEISQLPILEKEVLRINASKLFTIPKNRGIVSKTGGTTGKSLEILFTKDNMQERFAMLDSFRSQFGYELGKRTAWFSGKKLLSSNDLKRNQYWKTDNLYNVRYYSTFHIKEEYLKYYIENLIQYKPEYLVGFPSTIMEIAKYGLSKGYDFPCEVVKAIFPTAETITEEMRKNIEPFFKTKIYNQYASSEGAPFIFECIKGNLHMELQSGVFEVLDDHNQPAKAGRLVITSFTTEGTPLLRYDIGDSLVLEEDDKFCGCGNNNPLVKEILGRIDDFVFSPETGKVNLGNVSNTLKDTKGIIRFQAIQNELNKIEVLVVIDTAIYDAQVERVFKKNWEDRIGKKMELQISYVDEIPVEESGKFRIVKNSIKHLI